MDLNDEVEVWKPIPEWEEWYSASSLGRIRRHKISPKNWKMGILMPKFRSTYLAVDLKSDGVEKTCSVHRLVAVTFIENPENKREVNHKNGIRYDNRVCNLEWCTSTENVRHSIDVLGRVPNTRLTHDIIRAVIDDCKAGSTHRCAAKKHGINRSHVGKLLRGETTVSAEILAGKVDA